MCFFSDPNWINFTQNFNYGIYHWSMAPPNGPQWVMGMVNNVVFVLLKLPQPFISKILIFYFWGWAHGAVAWVITLVLLVLTLQWIGGLQPSVNKPGFNPVSQRGWVNLAGGPSARIISNRNIWVQYFVQVVCGSRSIAEVPEQLTVENEVVLNVISILGLLGRII